MCIARRDYIHTFISPKLFVNDVEMAVMRIEACWNPGPTRSPGDRDTVLLWLSLHCTSLALNI